MANAYIYMFKNNSNILPIRTLSDPNRWEVRLGFHSRLYPASSNYYITRKVSKIIKHEDFQSINLQNDIAVLVLDEDVQESNGVSPACVTRQIYWNGENCVSLGWGTTVQGHKNYNIYLKNMITFKHV